MATKKLGGCLCGEIRYSFSCDILSCYACHCTDCQTRSGAAFTLTAIVPKSEIQIANGTPKIIDWSIGTCMVCEACGVQLWVVADIVPDFALMKIGTLDDTSWVEPVAHIWTSSAQPWIRFDENAKKFPGMPENPVELVELWTQKKTS